MADSCEVRFKSEPLVVAFDDDSGIAAEEEKQNRFAKSSEDEIQKLLQGKSSANTLKATKTAVKVFRDYLSEKGLDINFERHDKAQINAVLRKFYVEARKKDGDFYKKSALTGIRFGINRHLQSVRRNIDIINDAEFNEANSIFKAQVVELKRRGKADITRTPDVGLEDLRKLYFSHVFDTDTAEGLVKKVFFDLMLLVCRRPGRENLRELKKDFYSIGVELSSGRKFVYQSSESADASPGKGLMFEKQGHPKCPVRSFEKYLTKLNPLNEWLWQRPKKNVSPFDNVWYENQVLGHNTLGDMMATISRDAKLSRIYTNHCIKVTPPSLLDSILYETLGDNITTTATKTLPGTTSLTNQSRTVSNIPILPATSKPSQFSVTPNSLLNSSQITTVPTSPSQTLVTFSSVSQNNSLPSLLNSTQTAIEQSASRISLPGLNQISSITTSNQMPQVVTVCLGQTVSASASRPVSISSGGHTGQLNTANTTVTPIQNQPLQFVLSNQNQALSAATVFHAQSLTTAMPISTQPLIVTSNNNQTIPAVPSNQSSQALNLGMNGQFAPSNHNQPMMVVAPNTNKAFALVPIEPQQMMTMSTTGDTTMSGSPLTTHVLDTARGLPARNLPIQLFIHDGKGWKPLASGVTNQDGRLPGLLTKDQFVPGQYMIKFDTESYFKANGITAYFYPYVEVVFNIQDPSQHYHVPLLLSPFSYSTYRGS